MATIGRVVNTHGVKGGLKILPLSDFLERVKSLKRVFMEHGERVSAYQVEDAFVHGRFWVVFLQDVEDMDSAERFKGALLKIPLTERVELPAGSYYLDQIIGLTVFTLAGLELGQVSDVLQTGSNDVYVVRQSEGPEILIPALKTVVKKIDLQHARLEVDLPEGLM
ncbi:MAG TPA: ribosome maturation factor RimM [Oscillospiraceae bacterium]|nr:ribosome maturation factor RimM [Oscillospiraceae bacterium]